MSGRDNGGCVTAVLTLLLFAGVVAFAYLAPCGCFSGCSVTETPARCLDLGGRR